MAEVAVPTGDVYKFSYKNSKIIVYVINLVEGGNGIICRAERD